MVEESNFFMRDFKTPYLGGVPILAKVILKKKKKIG